MAIITDRSFTTTRAGDPLDPSLFPDGLKTSGQKVPIGEVIRPYENFPKEVTGETVWRAEEYTEHPDKWTRTFSPAEIDELGEAADAFVDSKTPRTGISRVSPMLCNPDPI